MPPMKKGNEETKLSRSRKWTEDKHGLFAILLDEESSFALNLENLAPEKTFQQRNFYTFGKRKRQTIKK